MPIRKPTKAELIKAAKITGGVAGGAALAGGIAYAHHKVTQKKKQVKDITPIHPESAKHPEPAVTYVKPKKRVYVR
jgi:hypothetical protein